MVIVADNLCFAQGEEIVSETIGNQLNCGPNDSICNGPLRPNTEYQFKYRAYNSENNSIFAESDYSAPIKTGLYTLTNISFFFYQFFSSHTIEKCLCVV